MTSITLIRPHTHAGKAFTVGEQLDVEHGTADWLVVNGIARHDREPPSSLLPPEGNGKSPEPKTTSRKESKP
jgi:hypothetical protein